MAVLTKNQFKFRKHESVGSEGAEEDKEFLSECFVDTGDLEALRDIKHSSRIVVGRTGAGKTALLMLLKEKEENVSWIEPEELALQYISNSNIIQFLEGIGVDLDIFYRLLWRHIFTVELLKLKYNICNERDQQNFLARIYERYLGDRRKREAYEYFCEWGETFWQKTEYRIQEVTTKLEKEITGKLGGKVKDFSSFISGKRTATEEERKEILHRAQDVIHDVQLQKLSKIINTLAEDEFDNKQKKYFIIVDKLDEKWVGDKIRYKLIRALIESIKDLKKIETAKIIIALRKDLLDRVFTNTRELGYQEEKYLSLFLSLTWNKLELIEILNKRINHLVKKRYTKGDVTWSNIFTSKIGKEQTDNYLLARTMYRPRDIINFANCCVKSAAGKAEITATLIRSAESEYSEIRFRSLGDEWETDYPNLLDSMVLLKGRSPIFSPEDITEEQLENFTVNILANDQSSQCLLRLYCQRLFDGGIGKNELKRMLIQLYYRTGVLGIRKKNKKVNWSFLGGNVLKQAEITGKEQLEICPMFYRVLGVR